MNTFVEGHVHRGYLRLPQSNQKRPARCPSPSSATLETRTILPVSATLQLRQSSRPCFSSLDAPSNSIVIQPRSDFPQSNHYLLHEAVHIQIAPFIRLLSTSSASEFTLSFDLAPVPSAVIVRH